MSNSLDILSRLIWIQTVSKGTKVATNTELNDVGFKPSSGYNRQSGIFDNWEILHVFLSLIFLKNYTFLKNSFRNTIIVSNNLVPDQAQHFVGPDLGLNCLQKLSA